MIHSCGMTDLPGDVGYSDGVVTAARAALRAGAPVLCDAHMVAAGITRGRLPAGNEIVCTLSDPAVPALAGRLATTRSAAALALWGAGRGGRGGLALWGSRLGGAVGAIGNAPTALFRLLELLGDGAPRPAAVIGIPVGFIGAAESKRALAESGLGPLGGPGARGGSAIAGAAVNAIASAAE